VIIRHLDENKKSENTAKAALDAQHNPH